LERASFVVARRRKACLLAPPQHGAWRDPYLIAPLALLAPRGSRLGARLLRRRSQTKSVSARSSSARRVARSVFDCSARWLGEGQSLGGYWSTGAEDSITSTACLLVYGGA
jgi:hypothetical protein